MLLLVRWVQVMTRFERELYREPVRDVAELGCIWWDLVERHQLMNRPPGDRPTDWATKIHLALAPVYYQNYLLGELTASQVEHALTQATSRPLTGNRDAARFLRERYFRPGASVRWDALIESATGSPLAPDRFVAEFVER
jgi:peptidyl-dipeptidase A